MKPRLEQHLCAVHNNTHFLNNYFFLHESAFCPHATTKTTHQKGHEENDTTNDNIHTTQGQDFAGCWKHYLLRTWK